MISYAVMLAGHIGIPQLRDMAGRSEQLSADLKLDDMPRLARLSHPDADLVQRTIAVDMQLSIGAEGFPEVAGVVTGVLALQCQRCLDQLDWPVQLNFELLVVESDADVKVIANRFDAVVAEGHGIRLAGVVEDELLSSLPLAPRHEESVGCSAAALLGDNDKNIEVDGYQGDAELPEDTHAPFAGLASLLRSDAGSGKTDKT